MGIGNSTTKQIKNSEIYCQTTVKFSMTLNFRQQPSTELNGHAIENRRWKPNKWARQVCGGKKTKRPKNT